MAKEIYEKFSKTNSKKIFELATDFENLQKVLPEFFPSLRVISARPNSSLVESHLNLGGKELVVMAKHVIEKPILHEIFFVGGDAKGTQITEKYEQTPKGTKITLSVDFKHRGSLRFSSLFGKQVFGRDFSRIMDRIIEIAEN